MSMEGGKGGKGGRVVSWEGGRVVGWESGKGGRIVRGV